MLDKWHEVHLVHVVLTGEVQGVIAVVKLPFPWHDVQDVDIVAFLTHSAECASIFLDRAPHRGGGTAQTDNMFPTCG